MKRKVVAYVAIVISLVYVLLVFLYGYVFWKVKQHPSSPLPFFWGEGQGESSLILVDHQYTILKIPIEEMKIDLSALTNAVEILPLPETEIQRLALAHCKTWGYPSLQAHQHNLELLLPDFLVATQKLFRLLHYTDVVAVSDPFSLPLFFVPRLYPYTVAYCWKYGLRKENWKMSWKYFEQASQILSSLPEWQLNKGINFLLVASHPKTGPRDMEPSYLKDISAHASFLRTDLDFRGYSPKDLIVPYYVDRRIHEKEKMNATKNLLMFFHGEDNPFHGLRYSLSQESKALNDVKIHVTNGDSLEREIYLGMMSQSEFCLSIRGDTSSSSRLFDIISLGKCIPVIVADWIALPFEELIDYSKFTIRFPESISLLNMAISLRSISQSEKERYLHHLLQARELLLYPTAGSTVALFNPITLIFIEAVERRKRYCEIYDSFTVSSFCQRLFSRLSFARVIHINTTNFK
eukprot:gene11063-12058_t